MPRTRAPAPPAVLADRDPALRPSQRLVRATILVALCFCAVYGVVVWPSLIDPGASRVEVLVLAFKVGVEMLFSFAAATMVLVSVAYLLGRTGVRVSTSHEGPYPSIGVLYLCCGDLDRDAVASLRRLRYPGPLHLVVHDDTPGGDPRVDAVAAELASDSEIEFHLLRRPDRDGGKPAAINHVLDRLGHLFEFFVVCDNDSVALDRDCLTQLLAPMANPQTAVVQARNVAADDPDYCGVNRILSRAIDVFHLFLSMASRYGWTPFVGHNALLRRKAVEEAGGFTPGCFADDIDLTVRLNLRGYRVCYSGDVRFGEKHPPSYTAFRKRTYKWAYGSMQVLRRHLWDVLRTRELTLAEKWGFLHFIGFYTLQSLSLVYVAVLFLIAPFILESADFAVSASLVAGTLFPFLIFLPVIAFAIRHGRLRSLPGFLLTCWLGYGAADFPTARGTIHGLSRRTRRWIPTNSVRDGGLDGTLLAEAAFGLGLLLVPLVEFPLLLLSPLTFVVALKFLFIPTMSVLYRDASMPPVRVALRPVTAGIAVLLACAMLLSGARGQELRTEVSREPSSVAVRGTDLLVDGEPYVVRGVHYGPWRPGTGPGHDPYPRREEIAGDLDLIAQLNANTILVFDPPRYVLDEAWERGLRVLSALWIKWPDFGTPAFADREAQCLATVSELRDHPAHLGWLLGNEVPTSLLAERGADAIANDLRVLYDKVKKIDADHPVTHANWPNTRSLDLGFLDICAFNVYALWPPEVVARGYGNFIRDVIQPIAGDRPLLISEFGTNSLEAGEDGQARLTRECWQGLRGAGAIGGFVFAFADEWWKNYSNPKASGAWWDRKDAFDDDEQHDEDPEEFYGLVTGERRPKPAFAAVAAMYGASAVPPAAPTAPLSPAAVFVLAIVALAAGSLIWALWFTSRRRGAATRAIPHE